MRVLMRGSDRMSLEPKNRSLPDLLKRLSKQEVVFVRLEPGDATRYDFWLIPQGNPYLNCEQEFPTTDAHEYWVLVPANLGSNGYGLLLMDTNVTYMEGQLYNIYYNAWTRRVVGWFLAGLFEEVLDVRSYHQIVSTLEADHEHES